MNEPDKNYEPQQTGQPQVAVVGINPGTAGCLSIIFAVIGLPILAYIQPGKIGRGVVMQLVYWGLIGLAFLLPGVLGGMTMESASTRDAQDAVAFTSLFAMFFFPGLVWFAWIIVTAVDVNRCVKQHNAGKGVRYT